MKQFRNTQYNVFENGTILNTHTNNWIKPTKKMYNKNKVKRFCITLFINNNSKTFLYHRILAECFIPNPNNLPQINHKDGNPLNNELSNLEWCSALENNLHAINSGLRPTKLNKEIADEIRKEYNEGLSQKELRIKYSVGSNIISKIIRNVSWK